ncbi:MAG TPA: beta-ketoacyl synthase chain length factor [Bacteroidales bacterium]|nr:beta-ketoacyl synthase chain length factor [Bacteroidales bacterium]
MGIYIRSSGLISPQHTHNATEFPLQIYNGVSNRLSCIEPDYKTLINPILLRRMPRILKMGLASAQLCISRSGCINPDGIIVGTGLGCLDNLEKFLMDVLENNEHVTTVLPFINSTHNAVAAQISMLLKNQKYNTTYCHRSFSFETAVLDAMMIIEEDSGKKVLVGGIDECTPDFILLHSYLNAWKKPLNNLALLSQKTSGTIAGEGSGFFMVSGERGEDRNAVSIEGVHTFLTSETAETTEIWSHIDSFLDDHSIRLKDIDAVVLGINGDFRNDLKYYDLAKSCFPDQDKLYYKHLCGEYYTSGAFAVWLCSVILGNKVIPDILKLYPAQHSLLKTILIYNQVNNTEHSLICMKHDCL